MGGQNIFKFSILEKKTMKYDTGESETENKLNILTKNVELNINKTV